MGPTLQCVSYFSRLGLCKTYLFARITRHSKLNFTIIINPDSGPGATKFPNDDFNSQILRLNGYANVRTIGYVRTNYSARAISDVVADIAAYSGWADATTNQSLAMKGIFFDEAPSQYSPATNNYLQNINQAVDNASGIIGEKLVSRCPTAHVKLSSFANRCCRLSTIQVLYPIRIWRTIEPILQLSLKVHTVNIPLESLI